MMRPVHVGRGPNQGKGERNDRKASEGRAGRPTRRSVGACARFNRPGHGIVGAGGIIIERWLLDLPGIIVATADHKRRVLIGWPQASRDGELLNGGDSGRWLDAAQVEAVA